MNLSRIQNINYLIAAPPSSKAIQSAHIQLQKDFEAGQQVGQLFFYGDSVIVGTLSDYPTTLQALLNLAETHNVGIFLCSAGFHKRRLRLSAIAQQDFIFKGLGQFIAESQTAQVLRQFHEGRTTPPALPCPTSVSTASAVSVTTPKYTHLIALIDTQSLLSIKEFLDIAVVSASYDISVAVFMESTVITYLKKETHKEKNIELEQVFKMIGEFQVPLFSTQTTSLYQQKMLTASLTDLQTDSQHVLFF